MAEMRAIGIRTGRREAELFRMEAPRIKKPGEALLQMVSVGICGTDQDIIENSLADPPKGQDRMILGHEGFAKVIETGKKVSSLRKGDFVAIIPRHGCNICSPCQKGRSDYCETGLYTASGQHKRHGFNSEKYVEEEKYLVKAPKSIASVGALIEPFSVVEKAMEQIIHIQKRNPAFSLKDKKAMVFGMGSVGIAAIAILRAQNIKTYVLGRREENDPKVRLVKRFGVKYMNIRNKTVSDIEKETGKLDIIIEATGATQLVVDLIEILSRNGVYIFLGIPKGAEELCFNIKGMVNRIVRQNLVIAGSVNSQRIHFEMAIKDIAAVQKKYKNILDEVITHRFPVEKYREAFGKDDPGLIKGVMEYSKV